MPTDTFYNLNNSKRNKVNEAIINEFLNCPLESVSIKNIVTEAGIPRGSFYQYFLDKEDALRYIIDITGKENKENINADNLYDMILSILKKEISSFNKDKESIRLSLIKQISKSPRATSIFNEEITQKNIKSPVVLQLIKHSHLEFLSNNEIKVVMELLVSSLKDALFKSLEDLNKQADIEENLKLKISIIKSGVEEILLKKNSI